MNIHKIDSIEFKSKINEILVEMKDKEGNLERITLIDYYRIKYQL
jgi:hypothetical protein